ncbi:uncharacterized protein TNCV_1018001 [Trichonephila clavipes]|uniref:Tc1-like transposase DDE domain-containing protein n=1 Tax=Trichonephila clavipes TaxID=2585209 RepID=A0A8X7BBI8_TRICX|nr:uncharacterized protein TNCV_1018001 [Trichonephila clavipes]
MDDNATCHRTLAVQDCLDSEGIQCLVWPARSLDLNPIENVWDALGREDAVAAVAEWYRYRTVACFVTGSSPVPLKTRRVGQRCTLNLSRAETSSRWCGS